MARAYVAASGLLYGREASVGLFKILTFIGAALGFLFVLLSFTMSAPQQGAVAAVALFFVVAPYCVHGVIYRSGRD